MAKNNKKPQNSNFKTVDGKVLCNGFECDPIVEKCEGCERINEYEGQKYCSSYPHPDKKWERDVCNFATHVSGTWETGGKIKVNPLKASKRAARGR